MITIAHAGHSGGNHDEDHDIASRLLARSMSASLQQAQNQHMEVDIGKASAIINSYFAPFNHKPISTNVAVLELGEIEMIAVVD
jgi:hypothetical protein